MVKTQNSKSVNDMTVGSPLRAIIQFAIPLILGYILQQMYLIIDAAIVGRWIGVGALAAVGASSSIMFLIMGFCNGSCAGFAIPIAQAFGARDYAKMRTYVSNSIRIAVVLAVVITFLSCIFCEKILHLVNTPSEVFDDAYIFLMLQFAAIPFTIAYNLLSGQIRALGNSKQPFFFLITASVINIILDGILILGMGLGVEGAGIATWLSQGFSVLLCIWFIKKKMQILIPKGEERKFDNKKVSILLNNGVPMGLQFSITAIGLIMLECQQRLRNGLCSSLHCLGAHQISLHLRVREHRCGDGYLLRSELRRTETGAHRSGRKGFHQDDAGLLRLHLPAHLSLCRRDDDALRG